MPYIAIKTFPQEEAAKRRAAERIHQIIMEEWGAEADWISVSVEDVQPDEWDARVLYGEIEPNREHMLILDGRRLYE